MELRFHIYVFDFQVIFTIRVSLIEKNPMLRENFHNNKHETALQETVIDILQRHYLHYAGSIFLSSASFPVSVALERRFSGYSNIKVYPNIGNRLIF